MRPPNLGGLSFQSGYGTSPLFSGGAALSLTPLPNESEMFRLEMNADYEERAFLNALWKDPKDEAVREQYVDYLLDKNRQKSAEMVRGGYTPGFGY